MTSASQKSLLITFALLFAPTAVPQNAEPVSAPESPTQFARIAKDSEGRSTAFQLAIVTYVPRDDPTRLSVDLVGAVHIGDKSYYEELNERFTEYDALLYELVVSEGSAVAPGDSGSMSVLSSSQRMLGNLLDLTFQLEHVDYRQPNFVHADLSAQQLKQSMNDRGESLFVYFWRLYFASMKEYARDPLGVEGMATLLAAGKDYDLKTLFAYELVNLNEAGDFLGGENGSAIVAGRNERALQVLRQQLDTSATHFGIFYGVAHLPDLERHLLDDFDLIHHKTVWIDAWRLGGDSVTDAAN